MLKFEFIKEKKRYIRNTELRESNAFGLILCVNRLHDVLCMFCGCCTCVRYLATCIKRPVFLHYSLLKQQSCNLVPRMVSPGYKPLQC